MSEQNDTEESDFDPNFKLEPLPKASDIIAELPDYPDSDEEREVRKIMSLIKTNESSGQSNSLPEEKPKEPVSLTNISILQSF